jgi:hypothetical protein
MAGDRLGYVIVTYDPRSRRPFVGFMHDSLAGGQMEARDGMSANPGERHVLAEVWVMGEGDTVVKTGADISRPAVFDEHDLAAIGVHVLGEDDDG